MDLLHEHVAIELKYDLEVAAEREGFLKSLEAILGRHIDELIGLVAQHEEDRRAIRTAHHQRMAGLWSEVARLAKGGGQA